MAQSIKSDENYFENVFESGLLSVNTRSKYNWDKLQEHGNGFFKDINELPKTFVKTNGQQGRPNVPAWKKVEMKEKGLVIRTKSQDHPKEVGREGCMVFVQRVAKAV